MMKTKLVFSPSWLSFAAASLVLLPVLSVSAQTTPATPAQAPAAPAPSVPETSAPTPSAPSKLPSTKDQAAQSQPHASAQSSDRAVAYYHLALANIYEDEALENGNNDDARLAVDEYKYALNADPNSPQLNNGLADLYFRIPGHMHEAEVTARNLLKNSPNDIDAHRLLGRIYLRQLSDASNTVSSSSPSGNSLDQAIAEFEKIVALQPKSVEDRMVLGQLYTVKHQPKKAEDQFKTAQAIEPDSEEVVLNLARLYAESGDIAHAVKVIEAVPVGDRSPKMEVALGAAYDQLKQPKDAIAAYQRAADMDPADAHTLDALGQALLNNSQLDEALKQFKLLAEADPENAEPLVNIAEIQRRQGKLEDALATIRKARKIDPTSLEAGFKEAQLLDVLGRFDEASQTYEKMVDLTSHANGAYTTEEKSNRGFFLDHLAAIYREENKTTQAIATYQKMIDMGGDNALRGTEEQVEAYGEAKMFDQAADLARKAVSNNPKDVDLKLMLAGALVEQGKNDEALAMTKALLDNSDKDRQVWLKLGQFYAEMRRWKDAEDAYAKATPLSIKTDDRVYLLFLKGALAERQKHYEPAEQLFRQALELDPNNAATLNYLGYMLADKGVRLPEALKLIRKAVDLEPMNGAYLDSLGWAYFKLGQYEEAEVNLVQAAGRDQTDPTVHDHLGELYEKTGRIRLAAAQWELSIAEYAKSAPADIEPGEVAKVQRKLENARVKLAKQDSAVGMPKPE
ncbi:MAG TPA: tetratricopeptide repeat protein [Terracidiphilus sp.]|nr:tetratricopeptide repeat protein [Terracidiphilus sp.]